MFTLLADQPTARIAIRALGAIARMRQRVRRLRFDLWFLRHRLHPNRQSKAPALIQTIQAAARRYLALYAQRKALHLLKRERMAESRQRHKSHKHSKLVNTQP
jgi:hypothetical protein